MTASGGEFLLIVTPRFHHWNTAECPENAEADHYALDEPYQYEYFRFFEEEQTEAGFEIVSLLPAFQKTDRYPLVLRDDP